MIRVLKLSFSFLHPCNLYKRRPILQLAFFNAAYSTQQTHFGFQTVTEDEKEEKVHGVFDSVAENYDLMNDVMSATIHRQWKDYFVEKLAPRQGDRLLDVAGGTGDIAFRFLRHLKFKRRLEAVKKSDGKVIPFPESRVDVCDINQAMLEVGQRKAITHGYKRGIGWIHGDAECLPVKDNSYDLYTVAFGIRNMTHIEKVLTEAYRVLTPGGKFMCLEFSRVTNPLLRRLYDEYSFQVIPVMGQVIAGDWKSYQYLVESIRQFPDQVEFAGMIEEAGFHDVCYENLTFGIAAIHSGLKQ